MKVLNMLVTQLGSVLSEVKECKEEGKILFVNPFVISKQYDKKTNKIWLTLIPQFVEVDLPIRVKEHHIITDSNPTKNLLEHYKKQVLEYRNSKKIEVNPENVVNFRSMIKK